MEQHLRSVVRSAAAAAHYGGFDDIFQALFVRGGIVYPSENFVLLRGRLAPLLHPATYEDPLIPIFYVYP